MELTIIIDVYHSHYQTWSIKLGQISQNWVSNFDHNFATFAIEALHTGQMWKIGRGKGSWEGILKKTKYGQHSVTATSSKPSHSTNYGVWKNFNGQTKLYIFIVSFRIDSQILHQTIGPTSKMIWKCCVEYQKETKHIFHILA